MFNSTEEMLRAYFAAHAPKVPTNYEWKSRPDPEGNGTVCETSTARMIRWRWEYADAMLYEGAKNGSLE